MVAGWGCLQGLPLEPGCSIHSLEEGAMIVNPVQELALPAVDSGAGCVVVAFGLLHS